MAVAPLIPGYENLLALETSRLKISQIIDVLDVTFLDATNLTVDTAVIADSIIVPTPLTDFEAATKKYVDDLSTNIYWKDPCRVATTANITLSGLQTIDGISLSSGDRVLVKTQSIAINNGYYTASSSTWSRTSDMPLGSMIAGFACTILEGITYADQPFICTNNETNDEVGVNNLIFAVMSPGIQSLNLLTNGSQIMVTGVTGTDFAINSSGFTHTFNIPTASALNRGLLLSTNWTTFNNKLTSSLSNGNIFIGSAFNTASPAALSGAATLSSSGVLTLINSGVAPGPYTSSQFTVSDKGLLSYAVNGAALAAGADKDVQYKNGVSLAGTSNLQYDYNLDQINPTGLIVQKFPTAPVVSNTLTSSPNFTSSVDVSVSGSYAVLIGNSGFSIINISRISAAAVSFTSVGGPVLDVKFYGIFVYLITETNLFIYNVSNPFSPVLVSSSVPGSTLVCLEVCGTYVYIGTRAPGNIRTVDITNPSSPFIFSTLGLSGNTGGITISGNYMYVGGAIAIYVISLANPSTPSLISTTAATSAGTIFINGSILYVRTGFGDLTVYSIVNPTTLTFISFLTVSPSLTNMYMSGNYIYVTSQFQDRISIVDISNPSSLSIVLTITDAAILDFVNGIYVNGAFLYTSNNSITVSTKNFNTINVYSSKLSSGDIGSMMVNTLDTSGNAVFDGPTSITNGVQVFGSVYASDKVIVNRSVLFTKGLVTQITSLTTSVTINANQGIITTVVATLATDTSADFDVNNSFVRANSCILANVMAYAGAGRPNVTIMSVIAGKFVIRVSNYSTSALTALLRIAFLIF